MDGDGSTLTHTNELPNSLRDLIIANPHIKWIMATGRSLDLLHRTPIAKYLTIDVPHILDGGSRLMYLDGTSLIDYFISQDELAVFFKVISPDAVNFIYYSPDGIHGYAFSNQDSFKQTLKLARNKVAFTNKIQEFANWMLDLPPTKILINTKQNIRLDGLYYHQNDNNIDITTHGVNKGSACWELINRLDLTPDEIVFVFNDKNDLPVLEHANLSSLTTIKVGDWLPQVTSTYSVESPHEVASILHQLIR
jgi:hydroxymethylpyrimidine pyrophosphatase-like HAD family hydrolase